MTNRLLPAWEIVPATGNNDAAVKPIAPGFRFHPTDEELISYYLKRKFQDKPIGFNAIGEFDVYNHEPSNLAEHSRLKTKDEQWFFFTALENKYTSGTRIKRGTNKGYWKKTGEDIEIKRGDQLIGVIKSLVYHKGRSPKGKRTNWISHEYHLVENNIEIDSCVLCRVFRKKDLGPPTGCIFAPFSEQEWAEEDADNDGRALVPSVVHANSINEKIQQKNPLQSKNLIDLNELPGVFDMDDDNDEPLMRECLPLCVRNKEAPQDHCSFTAKTGDTIFSVSAMLEDKEPETIATMVPTSSSTELINILEKKKQQMAVERETYQLEITSAEAMISLLQGQIDALLVENKELKKIKSNKGQCS